MDLYTVIGALNAYLPNYRKSHSLFYFRYNLRRKSALRPSQSFDTMKSATSSVASDDTLEAVAGCGFQATPSSSAASIAAKDHLDLAADFPPLSASEADQIVPKWVTKSSTPPQVVSPPALQGSQPSAASKAGSASAPNEKVLSHQTNTAAETTETITDSKVTNAAEKTSDQQNMKNNPNSSSSSSFSPSAVIDASDVNKNPPEHSGAF